MLDPLNIPYHLRGGSRAEQPEVNTTACGLNTFTYQAAKLLNILPKHIKEANSIVDFKSLYLNGLEWNAILAAVIYAILTTFKWFHVGSLFLILQSFSFSNVVSIECLYGHLDLCDVCVDSMGFTFMVYYLFYRCDISLLATAIFGSVRLNFSVFYVCVFKRFSSPLSPISYHPSPSPNRIRAFG